MTKKVHFWKILFINLLVFLGLFLCLETGFKIFASDYQYYERTYAAKFPEKAIHQLDTNWVQPHSKFGWVCQQKEQLKFYRPDFFEVTYQINSEGFRNDFDFSETPKTDKKRVLLLGDSFLFGLFLEEQQTITQQLQFSDYQITNLAIPGWGIDQMHDAFQHYQRILQPDLTILLYIDEDIDRTLEAFFWGASTKPAYYLNDEKLTPRPPDHGSLNVVEEWFVFNFQIVNRIYRYGVFQQAEPLAKALFLSLKKATEKELLVIRFPRKEQVLDASVKRYDFGVFFLENEINFFDFEPLMQGFSEERIESLFIEGDNHPSVEGAGFIGEQIRLIQLQ